MASQKETTSQVNKYFDNWNLRRACFRYKRYFEAYACVHCRSRFTKACNLQRHTQTCAQGKTVIDCPAEKVELPQTAFEKVFYPKHSSSPESLRWLEKESALRKIHIHHAACGHGGERWVERAPVDGYNHETDCFSISWMSLAWMPKMFSS